MPASARAGWKAETAELLQVHEAVLEAHRSGHVESWMAVEAEEIISANRGAVAFPPLTERRAMRETYLASTTFSRYRDLRPPIVRISEDGTLGWVIVEVEAKGSQTVDGSEVLPRLDLGLGRALREAVGRVEDGGKRLEPTTVS